MPSFAAPVDPEARIDALLARFVTPHGPGAAVGVVRNGAFVHRKAYGLADLEWEIALGPDCVFRIASLTKQFTAMAVMILEESGRLSVEDRIERWLPEWPARGRVVTLAHLLNHTSGIWRHDSDLPERTRRPNHAAAEILQTIAERGSSSNPASTTATTTPATCCSARSSSGLADAATPTSSASRSSGRSEWRAPGR